MMLNLLLEQVTDAVARENFQKIDQFVREEQILKGLYKKYEYTFTSTLGGAAKLFPHGLPFTPKDLIQTSLKGSGTVQWNYSSFDATNISLTLGGTITALNPTTVRFYLGSSD